MNDSKTYLAVDFGGGSGRVMAGEINSGSLTLSEVHRFGNRQVHIGEHIYWDFPALFQDMKDGLRKAAQRFSNIVSIGIDTWGVDFALVDKHGNILGNPVCYRDMRTDKMPERFFEKNNATEHYAITGTQVMPINTLFQLLSMKLASDVRLDCAERLLFMPDLFSFYLTGIAASEYSIASTSEMLNARSKNWDDALISGLKLNRKLFCDIVMPGEVIGRLKKEIARELGLTDTAVVAVGSHDTASAVMAVPSSLDESAAWLSSGTWSLLGVSLREPILSEEARLASFTNEGGADGGICFLRNITGLWILQQLVKEWADRGETADYDILIKEAEIAASIGLIDVDAEDFQAPQSMEHAISEYSEIHFGIAPKSRGETVRLVLESLAATYAKAINELNALLTKPVEKLYIIGGGSRNALLNQLTANATQMPVEAGPVEATAIGNILVQAKAMGDISSSDELHQIVRRSAKTIIYLPKK